MEKLFWLIFKLALAFICFSIGVALLFLMYVMIF